MEHHQTENGLTAEQHQRYVEARQKEGMYYIADYDRWLEAHRTLAELQEENENDTWENSEHNPENYPDFEGLDKAEQARRLYEGDRAYWRASEALERRILELETDLSNPDDFEKVTDEPS